MEMDWYVLFLFKQKTAFEMRIMNWSSDGCSADLLAQHVLQCDPVAALDAEGARDLALAGLAARRRQKVKNVLPRGKLADRLLARGPIVFRHLADRKSVV